MNSSKKHILLSSLIIIQIFLPNCNSRRPVKSFQPPPPMVKTIRVGIFSDNGVGVVPGKHDEYARELKLIIKNIDPGCKPMLINSEQINDDILDLLDVVLFPGGSGSIMYEVLGPTGRARVKKFVIEGGGYVGICAGAYLGRNYRDDEPNIGLQLANVKSFKNSKNWNRGDGIIKVKLTNAGRKMIPELRRRKYVYLFYKNGPLLIPANDPGMQKYDQLMTIASNIYHNNPEAVGESPGKTLLIRARRGKGTVVLMSGHPEFTPGLKWMLPRMIRWAARRRPIPYNRRFVRPSFFQREIMYTWEWKGHEKIFLDKIKDNGEDKILPLKKLVRLGSIDLCPLLPGLLFHKSPDVRKLSADIIKRYDFFPALSALRRALRVEKDAEVRKAIYRAILHLR